MACISNLSFFFSVKFSLRKTLFLIQILSISRFPGAQPSGSGQQQTAPDQPSVYDNEDDDDLYS